MSKFLGRWDESQPACSFTVDLSHTISWLIQHRAWICISKLKDFTVKCKRWALKKSLQKSFKDFELFFLPLNSHDFSPRPMKLEKAAYLFCMPNIFSSLQSIWIICREKCVFINNSAVSRRPDDSWLVRCQLKTRYSSITGDEVRWA